jgi:hypothetical protein
VLNKKMIWYKENIRKNGYYIGFGVIFLAITAFLIFQRGYWTYLDLSYESAVLLQNPLAFQDLFHVVTSYTTFGYDNTQLFSTRFINIFSEVLIIKTFTCCTQIVYFFLYFWLSFILARKSLELVFGRQASYWGALLFTFNPVSVYLLNEAGFFFVYFSLPLIVYAGVSYFKKEELNYGYIILFALGISLLSSYVRVSFVYFGILLILAGVYYKNILELMQGHRKKWLNLSLITLLIILPIFFSFAYPRIIGDDKYFSGISNYAGAFMQFGESVYDKQSRASLWQGLLVTELTENFAAQWQKTWIFKIFSISYFLSSIFLSVWILFKRNIAKEHRRLGIVFLFILGGSIFLKMLAHFTSQEIFIQLSYVYLPFLANTTFWVMLGFIVGFTGLLAFLLTYSTLREKRILLIFTGGYIFFSIVPFLIYRNNVKLKTVAMENVPQEYQIFSQQTKQEAAIFFPDRNLYFSWAPYPIDISQGKYFQEIFSNNVRLVNAKQAKLYEQLYTPSLRNNMNNLYFFNGKNIFIFKDVRNNDRQFDYFARKNYVQLSQDYYNKMREESAFVLQDDNAHFAHFIASNADKADFAVYSPKTILFIEPEDFFAQENIDMRRRAMLVDKKAFGQPSNLSNIELNPDIKLAFKTDIDNATKQVVKIENIQKGKTFLIQLNKTFGRGWKIKWVDKTYFEKSACLDDWKDFVFSHNSSCHVKFFNWNWYDIALLWAPSVRENHHFEGNFVGNTWLVTPTDIPKNLQQEQELHAVLIYEKQIYYEWLIALASGVIIFSGSLVGKNWLWKKLFKKNNRNKT